jgi:hypothetical protein
MWPGCVKLDSFGSSENVPFGVFSRIVRIAYVIRRKTVY